MSVQPERRYHRFRMCKAHLISEDRFNEMTANAKRQTQKEEAVRIAAANEQAEGKNLKCTVEAVAAALHAYLTRQFAHRKTPTKRKKKTMMMRQ
eukprot:9525-Amphidinium_carterae.1